MCRRLILTGIPLMLVACLGSDAAAQRIRLEARFGFNDGPQTTAKYEQRNQRRKLNVELEDVAPRTNFVVQIWRGNRRLLSRVIRSNGLGVAELDIDNTEGDVVPRVRAGNMVVVRAANGDRMQGILRVR